MLNHELEVYSEEFLLTDAHLLPTGVAGICFETQFYPNSCNKPKFPSCILEAGKKFRSRTIYKFGLEN